MAESQVQQIHSQIPQTTTHSLSLPRIKNFNQLQSKILNPNRSHSRLPALAIGNRSIPPISNNLTGNNQPQRPRTSPLSPGKTSSFFNRATKANSGNRLSIVSPLSSVTITSSSTNSSSFLTASSTCESTSAYGNEQNTIPSKNLKHSRLQFLKTFTAKHSLPSSFPSPPNSAPIPQKSSTSIPKPLNSATSISFRPVTSPASDYSHSAPPSSAQKPIQLTRPSTSPKLPPPGTKAHGKPKLASQLPPKKVIGKDSGKKGIDPVYIAKKSNHVFRPDRSSSIKDSALKLHLQSYSPALAQNSNPFSLQALGPSRFKPITSSIPKRDNFNQVDSNSTGCSDLITSKSSSSLKFTQNTILVKTSGGQSNEFSNTLACLEPPAFLHSNSSNFTLASQSDSQEDQDQNLDLQLSDFPLPTLTEVHDSFFEVLLPTSGSDTRCKTSRHHKNESLDSEILPLSSSVVSFPLPPSRTKFSTSALEAEAQALSGLALDFDLNSTLYTPSPILSPGLSRSMCDNFDYPTLFGSMSGFNPRLPPQIPLPPLPTCNDASRPFDFSSGSTLPLASLSCSTFKESSILNPSMPFFSTKPTSFHRPNQSTSSHNLGAITEAVELFSIKNSILPTGMEDEVTSEIDLEEPLEEMAVRLGYQAEEELREDKNQALSEDEYEVDLMACDDLKELECLSEDQINFEEVDCVDEEGDFDARYARTDGARPMRSIQSSSDLFMKTQRIPKHHSFNSLASKSTRRDSIRSSPRIIKSRRSRVIINEASSSDEEDFDLSLDHRNVVSGDASWRNRWSGEVTAHGLSKLAASNRTNMARRITLSSVLSEDMPSCMQEEQVEDVDFNAEAIITSISDLIKDRSSTLSTISSEDSSVASMSLSLSTSLSTLVSPTTSASLGVESMELPPSSLSEEFLKKDIFPPGKPGSIERRAWVRGLSVDDKPIISENLDQMSLYDLKESKTENLSNETSIKTIKGLRPLVLVKFRDQGGRPSLPSSLEIPHFSKGYGSVGSLRNISYAYSSSGIRYSSIMGHNHQNRWSDN
ncbi:expressed protein [Phakopsora pachyrhizi]|uniref:Expressed protein n=1 Tax=Phakopsora pachyrhizi TaxID=170000 RepID=A0AAV0BLV9_PHAPC|nr:expressed protein [Phakopsora pachyrhizi]